MLLVSNMKKISAENCIEIIKETFPGFIPYFDSYVKDCGPDNGISIEFMIFADFAIDVIKSGYESEIKKAFNFVEMLMSEGTQDV